MWNVCFCVRQTQAWWPPSYSPTPRFQRTLAREGMSFVEIMRVLCECILGQNLGIWAEWTVQFTGIYIDLYMEVFCRSNILERHTGIPQVSQITPQYRGPEYDELPVRHNEESEKRYTWFSGEVCFRNPMNTSWSSLYIENLPCLHILTGFSHYINRCRISIMTDKYKPVLKRLTMASECVRLGGHS